MGTESAFLEKADVMCVLVINIQLETVLIIGNEAGALAFQITLVTKTE
jgi:hypothetical protein